MGQETVEIDRETSEKLNKLTKRELIERFCIAALEAETYKLRCQTAVEAERKAQSETEFLKKTLADEKMKLAKAEAYVEQGRAMINSVMERWYEYDT